MTQNILQSVLTMTEQHTVAALEHNLPVALASVLPVQSISIFKPFLDNDYREVEEVLKFLVQENEPAYLWSAETQVQQADQLLQNCFSDDSVQEDDNSDLEKIIYYPITLKGKTQIALRVKSSPLNIDQRKMLDDLTNVYKNHLNVLNDSEQDKLTSLLNRRSFEQRFDSFVNIQENYPGALWELYEKPEKRKIVASSEVFLAVIELDQVKQRNNNYGDTGADEILVLIADIMRDTFRRSDLLFRFEGEKFLILMEPTSLEHAYQTLERFREKVKNYTFPQIGQLTTSIGYTTVKNKNYIPMVYSHANQALYYAKNNGCNRTCCYEQLIEKEKLIVLSEVK